MGDRTLAQVFEICACVERDADTACQLAYSSADLQVMPQPTDGTPTRLAVHSGHGSCVLQVISDCNRDPPFGRCPGPGLFYRWAASPGGSET